MEHNFNSQNITILKREKIYISKRSSNKENLFSEIVKFDSSNEFEEEEEEVHFVKTVKLEFEEKTVKIWECGICNKDFSHNCTLIRHLRTHSEDRSFKCRECEKSFRQLSTLTQHKAIHSTERPFVCDLCERSFNRISTLISHKKIHSGDKPYKCEYCEKSFHQKGNLKNHLFIHTNARPYMCNLCKRGFNQMSNLVCHQKKFHPKDNSTVWNCSICFMAFEKQSGLRSHELKEHPKNKLPVRLEITIPAIKTEAFMQAKANNEIPFALIHTVEGNILVVRIIDSGNSSLIKEAGKEDFKLLKNSENSKITLPMVADIHQRFNENGIFEYLVRPPDTSFNFLNDRSVEENQTEQISETLELPDQELVLEETECSDIELLEPVVNKESMEIPSELMFAQPPTEPVEEIIDLETFNEDLSFLNFDEYMSLIDAIHSGGYEPNFEGINNYFAENNISLNF